MAVSPPTMIVLAATSVGAFIGRTLRGPVNVPVTCLSFADFQRKFGPLSLDSAVGYQASGFFENGGNQAEVVRLHRLPAVTITAVNSSATTTGTFTITFALLPSGPTVEVTTGARFSTTAAADAKTVYDALADELASEPALVGVVTNINSSTTGLTFDVGSACSICGGGPPTWTFTPEQGTAASTIRISGSSQIAFDSAITFSSSAGLAADAEAVVAFTPVSGAPFTLAFTAPSDLSANALATTLYELIERSSQASALVRPREPGSTDTSLTLDYIAATTVTITLDNVLASASATSVADDFALEAANPGRWGDSLIAAVDTDGIDDDVARQYGLPAADLFNLTVIDEGPSPATSERFTAVTLNASAGANRLDRVLANGSLLVRLASSIGGPAPSTGAWGRGRGGVDSAPLQATDYHGNPVLQTGLYAFNQNPYGFNILSVPPDDAADPNGGDISDVSIYQTAAQICVENNAMLILDPPTRWYDEFRQGNIAAISLDDLGSYTDEQGRACATYFPRIVIADPLRKGLPKVVVPSGYLAGVWASVDTTRGVWAAPAGLDTPIGGILELQADLDDRQNGVLNPQGINALRCFTGSGNVVWGARTLRGADQLGDPCKYIQAQRLSDFIETSVVQSTQWAVFEPNGPSLWSALRSQVSNFMNGLFTQGAFAGTAAKEAYFVTCDATTTTPADVAAGVVNVQVGFALTYPAEFIVITISQQTLSGS